MIAADAIVMETPVCFYAMNGQLKAFVLSPRRVGATLAKLRRTA